MSNFLGFSYEIFKNGFNKKQLLFFIDQLSINYDPQYDVEDKVLPNSLLPPALNENQLPQQRFQYG